MCVLSAEILRRLEALTAFSLSLEDLSTGLIDGGKVDSQIDGKQLNIDPGAAPSRNNHATPLRTKRLFVVFAKHAAGRQTAASHTICERCVTDCKSCQFGDKIASFTLR